MRRAVWRSASGNSTCPSASPESYRVAHSVKKVACDGLQRALRKAQRPGKGCIAPARGVSRTCWPWTRSDSKLSPTNSAAAPFGATSAGQLAAASSADPTERPRPSLAAAQRWPSSAAGSTASAASCSAPSSQRARLPRRFPMSIFNFQAARTGRNSLKPNVCHNVM